MSKYSDQLNWLREWYNTQTGKRLLSIEANLISQLLDKRFRRFVLQIGSLGWEKQFLTRENQANYFLAVEQPVVQFCVPATQCQFDALPIETDSIDLIVIPHVLEFVSSPWEVIQEAERVLKPEGQLVILGFSPWSLLGISRVLPVSSRLPEPNFISSRKMRQWLEEMRFEEVESTRLYSGFGRLSTDLFEGQYHPVLGASYVIRATKRRYTLIPLRPEWAVAKTKIKQPGFIDASLRKVSNDR